MPMPPALLLLMSTLPVMVELMTVTNPPSLSMPAATALPVVLLLAMVLSRTISVPTLPMPPAEPKGNDPEVLAGAWLLLTMMLCRINVPQLVIPVPLPLATVRPDRIMAGSVGWGLVWVDATPMTKIPKFVVAEALRSTVSRFAPGPMMFVLAVRAGKALSRSMAPVTPASKTMVLPGLASAAVMAARSEPLPLSLVFVTWIWPEREVMVSFWVADVRPVAAAVSVGVPAFVS